MYRIYSRMVALYHFFLSCILLPSRLSPLFLKCHMTTGSCEVSCLVVAGYMSIHACCVRTFVSRAERALSCVIQLSLLVPYHLGLTPIVLEDIYPMVVTTYTRLPHHIPLYARGCFVYQMCPLYTIYLYQISILYYHIVTDNTK